MSANANYFFKDEIAPAADDTVIVVIPARYVPIALSAVEGRKPRSFWASDADYIAGADALTRLQIGILMDAKEDIIREIRGVRGSLTPGEPTDLTSYPVGTFPGWSLGDIGVQLNDGGQNIAQLSTAMLAKQEEIRALLEANGGNGESLLAQLELIAGLLAV